MTLSDQLANLADSLDRMTAIKQVDWNRSLDFDGHLCRGYN